MNQPISRDDVIRQSIPDRSSNRRGSDANSWQFEWWYHKTVGAGTHECSSTRQITNMDEGTDATWCDISYSFNCELLVSLIMNLVVRIQWLEVFTHVRYLHPCARILLHFHLTNRIFLPRFVVDVYTLHSIQNYSYISWKTQLSK